MQGDVAPNNIRYLKAAEPVPDPALARSTELPGPACPANNENVPYSARCLAYLKGATEIGMRWQIKADEPARGGLGAARLTITERPRADEFAAIGTACPSNDTRPYNIRCLAFLQGSPAIP